MTRARQLHARRAADQHDPDRPALAEHERRRLRRLSPSGANAVSSGARTTNTGTDNTLAYHLNLQFGDDPTRPATRTQAVLMYTATTP